MGEHEFDCENGVPILRIVNFGQIQEWVLRLTWTGERPTVPGWYGMAWTFQGRDQVKVAWIDPQEYVESVLIRPICYCGPIILPSIPEPAGKGGGA